MDGESPPAAPSLPLARAWYVSAPELEDLHGIVIGTREQVLAVLALQSWFRRSRCAPPPAAAPSSAAAGGRGSGEEDSRRVQRLDAAAAQRMSGVCCVLENVRSMGNRAAVLRSCEAFGILDFHELRVADGSVQGRDCNGGEKWVRVHRHNTLDDLTAVLSARGFTMCAAVAPPCADVGREVWPASSATAASANPRSAAQVATLKQINFGQRIALVFGNEQFGVSEAMQACCRVKCAHYHSL